MCSKRSWLSTEFVVLPIFGQDGQPEYQIEIHLGRSAGLTLSELDAALRHAQGLLSGTILKSHACHR